MLPKYHIIFSAIIILFLYSLFPLTPWQIAIIFLSSFIVDVDHYFYGIFKLKTFNLFEIKKWFMKNRSIWREMNPKQKRKYKLSIIIFHGVEFWVLLLILAQFYKPVYFVLIGIFIHFFQDLIEMIQIQHPIYHKISFIYVLMTNKKKKEFNF